MSAAESSAPEFIDTNVLVYAQDASAGSKREMASKLLERLWEERRGALSVQVLQEFAVVALGKTRPPLERSRVKEVVKSLSLLAVHSPAASDVLAALDLGERYPVSFWDAMIVQSAKRLGCRVIWSEDLSDGVSYDGVEVRNPFGQSATGKSTTG